MKRSILLLLLLAMSAQAQPRTSVCYVDCTVVLDNTVLKDSSDVDTLMIPVWTSNMRGYPHLQIIPAGCNVDSDGVAGSKNCTQDSLTVMWRPTLGPDPEDTLTGAVFKCIPIWRCGTANATFSWMNWDSAGIYWGILDFEGQTPDWIQIRTAYKGYSHHDSAQVEYKLYDIQK